MKQKVFEKRFSILVGLHFVGLLLLVFLLLPRDNKDADHFRRIGSKLHAAGVASGAVEYYKKYLEIAGPGVSDFSKVALSIAELSEQIGQREEALSWYYQAQMGPETETIAAKKVVALLESMGKTTAAKSELGDLTALTPKEGDKGSPLLAQVGEVPIYQHQIDAALDRLPENVRKQYQSKRGKENFLRQYVANEILYKKAERLQFQDRPEVKAEVEELRKQILVGKILNEEILSKMKLDQSDIKNYFEANISRFQKGKDKPKFADVQGQVTQQYRMEKVAREMETLVQEAVQGEQVKFFTERIK